MDINVFAHRGVLGRVLALEGIAANFESTAMPGVDCGFGSSEGVGVPNDEFGAEQFGCTSQYLQVIQSVKETRGIRVAGMDIP